ncbi:amidase [Salsipaludibacter albus]|uniref:amidase n=1 Tax=Salsipaludibacter albus TaxID=2849650 RepID=UPI001EE3CA77
MDEVIGWTARRAVAELRAGEVRPSELVEASLARIADVDGAVNALPTVVGERALDRARGLEETARVTGTEVDRGWLGGLPLAIKDLTDVAGVRTTRGSTLFADRVPETSDLLVERLESKGGIVVAKSNTPEFGNGAHTTNEVFGATRNPWDTTRSPGGSSGGATAALTTGQVWLAQGTDVGGSLRTPASFCGVVGLRPTPGRVVRGPGGNPFDDVNVSGPMGRTVGDVALGLDAMAGVDRRDPMSLPVPDRAYVDVVDHAEPPRRLAFTPDLDGYTTVDPEVVVICRSAVARLAALGTDVVEASPDTTGLHEAYHLLRARLQADFGEVIGDRLDETNADVQWNVGHGRDLTGADQARGRRLRAEVYARWVAFLDDVDLLALPAAIVPPPSLETRSLSSYRGMDFATYIDWVKITFLATTVASPALVVPVGVTASGLPVGLQLVGPPRREDVVLAAGAVLEADLGLDPRPIDPRGPMP